MEYSIFVELNVPVNSLELYDKLEPFDINVTDVISTVLVYGRVTDLTMIDVLKILDDYSYTRISLERIKP